MYSVLAQNKITSVLIKWYTKVFIILQFDYPINHGPRVGAAISSLYGTTSACDTEVLCFGGLFMPYGEEPVANVTVMEFGMCTLYTPTLCTSLCIFYLYVYMQSCMSIYHKCYALGIYFEQNLALQLRKALLSC